MSKKEKQQTQIDLFNRLDASINMEDVINVMVSDWESNQIELIKSKGKELTERNDQLKDADQKFLQMLLDDTVPDQSALKMTIGSVSHAPSIVCGSRYGEHVNSFHDLRIIANYDFDHDFGRFTTSIQIPISKSRNDSMVVEFYEKREARVKMIDELKAEIRNLKIELTKLSVKERKLKAEISKKRLESNADFKALMEDGTIAKLLEASSDSL